MVFKTRCMGWQQRGGREHGVKNIPSPSQLCFPGAWKALGEGRNRDWSGWPMGKKIREPRSSVLEITGSQELLGYNNGSFTVLLSCVLRKQSFSFQLI